MGILNRMFNRVWEAEDARKAMESAARIEGYRNMEGEVV